METKNILVVIRGTPEQLSLLQQAAPDAQVIRQSLKTLERAQVEQADVVVGNLPEEYFPALKRARLLQLNSAGVGKPYLELARSRPDLVLCCASGAYGLAIAEHLMGALLMLMKHLHRYRDDQAAATWVSRGEVRSVYGSNILVLGMGDIGTQFAQRASALGAEIIGVRRRPASPPEGVRRMATMQDLDTLLPWADVVVMSLPETEQTIGVMDKRRLQLMKKNSYLLNVGRGSAVDQDALAEAMAAGHLAGAHLDVTSPEPLPKEHPLWRLPNVFITPHVSGNFNLPLTVDFIYQIAAHNIRALREGGAYRSLVDANTGYRA